MVRSYVIGADTAAMTLRSDRRAQLPPPQGAGSRGSPSISVIEAPDGRRETLPTMNMGMRALGGGDTVIHVAAGGAGFGDPLERPAAEVLDDIADGRIDAAFARAAYGVVIDARGQLDQHATEAARSDLACTDRAEREHRQWRLFLHGVDASAFFRDGA